MLRVSPRRLSIIFSIGLTFASLSAASEDYTMDDAFRELDIHTRAEAETFCRDIGYLAEYVAEQVSESATYEQLFDSLWGSEWRHLAVVLARDEVPEDRELPDRQILRLALGEIAEEALELAELKPTERYRQRAACERQAAEAFARLQQE